MDPADPTRYINLAIHILNRGLVRNVDGAFVTVPGKKDRLKFAIPFMARGLEIAEFNPSMQQRLVSVLVRAGALKEAHEIASGNLPGGEYDEGALQYVMRQRPASDSAVAS